MKAGRPADEDSVLSTQYFFGPGENTMKQIFPLSFIVIAALLGCDAGGDSLAPVRGRVYYKGTPLGHGTIVFIPDEDRGNGGPMARAEIGPDGGYTMQSGERSGAAVGWHRVTVTSVEIDPASGGPRTLLPAKYSDPALSGLSCAVKPGRENRIDFRLD